MLDAWGALALAAAICAALLLVFPHHGREPMPLNLIQDANHTTCARCGHPTGAERPGPSRQSTEKAHLAFSPSCFRGAA